MESRKTYNYLSVCRFPHARFHVFIIWFLMVTWNLTWIIIIPLNVALGHARFHSLLFYENN
jgi:hypothetical protein